MVVFTIAKIVADEEMIKLFKALMKVGTFESGIDKINIFFNFSDHGIKR